MSTVSQSSLDQTVKAEIQYDVDETVRCGGTLAAAMRNVRDMGHELDDDEMTAFIEQAYAQAKSDTVSAD
jgi:hypothetical protein